MSLRPTVVGAVPKETARVVRAAFPGGHPYVHLADALGALFSDELFAGLYVDQGRPVLAPWRLTLVTILQFAEGLSDRQAADAVRSRIDWKYVLRLPLTDPGFDASVLSEFRARLLGGEAERVLLDTLLTWCRERGLLKVRGRQRTDSTHVLAKVRALNRLELVVETLRHALDALAVLTPDWLLRHSQPEWAKRYSRRVDDARLPASKEARTALAVAIGADGYALLAAARGPDAPEWLRLVPAVETLRRVWVQNYTLTDGRVGWRADDGADGIPPAAQFVSSPHDGDAHYARKETVTWVGYKVHLTETCEEELPCLVTNVVTTAGPVVDAAATPVIHAALEERDLLPAAHIVDTGYLDAALLVTSRQRYGVDLVGPARPDSHWQARANAGFAAQDFRVDWAAQQATCPAGHTSSSWTPAVDSGKDVVKIKFSASHCRRCPFLAQCVRSTKKYPRRALTVRRQAQYEALAAARQRQQTPAYATAYARRAGIEGTLSRGVRRCRLRRTRYVGQDRTHLGHVLTALGLNFLRLGEWLSGLDRPTTRRSRFATLMASAVAA